MDERCRDWVTEALADDRQQQEDERARKQRDDWQLTLAVRDAIAAGLRVRAGAELTPAVIQERAANMAIALREQFDVRRRA